MTVWLKEKHREIILLMAECNMNVSSVARRMYFHRNNIEYHMDKIRDHTGLDPRKFYDLISLVAAVKEDT